jgi:NADPH:quinone reductase-like Zn-dependent oxidoreductase
LRKSSNACFVLIRLFCQFIDYTAHPSLPEYLKSKYSKEPFDSILDCAGIQSLYANSPGYLKPSGSVVNVGAFEGLWETSRNWFTNTWWPKWLGGVPRRYIMFSTPPSKDAATYTAKLIEEGKVRILIDSVWDMEDLVKAYARIATKRARGKVLVKVGKD